MPSCPLGSSDMHLFVILRLQLDVNRKRSKRRVVSDLSALAELLVANSNDTAAILMTMMMIHDYSWLVMYVRSLILIIFVLHKVVATSRMRSEPIITKFHMRRWYYIKVRRQLFWSIRSYKTVILFLLHCTTNLLTVLDRTYQHDLEWWTTYNDVNFVVCGRSHFRKTHFYRCFPSMAHTTYTSYVSNQWWIAGL